MGCEGCARAILLVFNIIFFLVGGAALGVGIWVVVDGNVFLEVLGKIPDSGVYGSLIADAAYIIIGAGAAIFLIAFFGCCGAWKKNKCMLMTYAIIIGVLVLLEIACLVVAYFFYDQVVGVLTTGLATALNATYDSKFVPTGTAGEYTYTPGSIISKGVDAIQMEFSCCGVNDYKDYYNDDFPATCCPPDTANTDIQTLVDTLWKETMTTYTTTATTCYGNPTYMTSKNVTGCVEAIREYVQSKSIIFMAIAGGTLGVQIFLIIFACCVAKAADDEVKDYA